MFVKPVRMPCSEGRLDLRDARGKKSSKSKVEIKGKENVRQRSWRKKGDDGRKWQMRKWRDDAAQRWWSICQVSELQRLDWIRASGFRSECRRRELSFVSFGLLSWDVSLSVLCLSSLSWVSGATYERGCTQTDMHLCAKVCRICLSEG